MDIANIPWARALGFDSQSLQQARHLSRPEFWWFDGFKKRYYGSYTPFSSIPYGPSAYFELDGANLWYEKLDSRDARLLDVDVYGIGDLELKSGGRLRARIAGGSLWQAVEASVRESDRVADPALLATSMLVDTSAPLDVWGRGQGPVVAFRGHLISARREGNPLTELSFYELEIQDALGNNFCAYIAESDFVGRIGEVVCLFGMLVARAPWLDHEASLDISMQNDRPFTYGPPMSVEKQGEVLVFSGSMWDAFEWRPTSFRSAWDEKFDGLMVRPGDIDFEWDNFALSGVFQVRHSDGGALAFMPARHEVRVIPAVLDSEQLWGGGLVATAGAICDSAHELVRYCGSTEPRVYGDVVKVVAELYEVEEPRDWFLPTFRVRATVDGKPTVLFFPPSLEDQIRDLAPGSYFVGSALRIIPADPRGSDFPLELDELDELEEPIADVHRTASEACELHRLMELRYCDADRNRTVRVIEPHVVTSGRNPIVRAYDLEKADWRTFLVSRIERATMLETEFAERPLPL